MIIAETSRHARFYDGFVMLPSFAMLQTLNFATRQPTIWATFRKNPGNARWFRPLDDVAMQTDSRFSS